MWMEEAAGCQVSRIISVLRSRSLTNEVKTLIGGGQSMISDLHHNLLKQADTAHHFIRSELSCYVALMSVNQGELKVATSFTVEEELIYVKMSRQQVALMSGELNSCVFTMCSDRVALIGPQSILKHDTVLAAVDKIHPPTAAFLHLPADKNKTVNPLCLQQCVMKVVHSFAL